MGATRLPVLRITCCASGSCDKEASAPFKQGGSKDKAKVADDRLSVHAHELRRPELVRCQSLA